MSKILIVEDESMMQEALLAGMHKEKSLEVIQAWNGEEGLKMALEQKPDLILLDIVMPKMDGMSMLNKLRNDEWGKTVKVIMLTNLNDGNKVAEAISQGSFEYLVKTDWKIKDIVDKVKRSLGA